VPDVKLAGPVLDAVWSPSHHLVACCALADQAPPLLVFVGGDPERPRAPPLQDRQLVSALVAKPVPLRDAPRETPRPRSVPALQYAPHQREWSQMQSSPSPFFPMGSPSVLSVAPTGASSDWASSWIGADSNPRSAISLEEKQRMKAQILTQLAEKKGSMDLERTFASLRSLPGGA